MCTTTTASSTTAAATSTSASSASSSSSAEATTAIAGAVVGCVVGLGAIAAVCLYFFWFRPRQQRATRQKEIEEQSQTGSAFSKAQAVQVGGMQEKGDDSGGVDKPAAAEMRQLPPEMLGHFDRPELESGTPTVSEAPGSPGGYELGTESGPAPVELPGDHEYRGSGSDPTNSEQRGAAGETSRR